MIYLIDDSSFEYYHAEYVFDDKYQEILCIIRDEAQLIEKRLEMAEADCIMVHYSFRGSRLAKEQMAELADDGDKIPFVVFSGGDSEQAVFDDKNPNLILEIKKSTFYERLIFFLDNYIQTKSVNLRILAYGQNYIRTYVQRWAVRLMRLIAGRIGMIKKSDIVDLEKLPEFKEIINASSPALGITYDNLIERLREEDTSFDIFCRNILNIVNSFNQYGKNIYPWK